MQTFLKPILILHENREKSKLFKQIYRLKLAFSHTSCIYFTELHLTFHLTSQLGLLHIRIVLFGIKKHELDLHQSLGARSHL